MDPAIIEQLKKAGIDLDSKERLAKIGAPADESGHARTDTMVFVVQGEKQAELELKTIPELWEGNKQPPQFSGPPPKAYERFFLHIEMAAMDACCAWNQRVTDQEFERLYTLLRKRPAGEDANPLFAHLQGAVALWMSVHPVSKAEFEAVMQRLARSARHFSGGHSSTRYLDTLLSTVGGQD